MIYPAEALGVDGFTSGWKFGLSICINDGDAGGGTQDGWNGWAPYGIVVGGKLPENVGQAELVGVYTAPPTLASWVPAPVVLIATVEVENLRWNIKPAPTLAGITLDADLGDWDLVPFKAQAPFRPCDKTGEGAKNGGSTCEFVTFDQYNGGIWNGIYDQSSALATAWSPEALYLGIKVIDDLHQNPGDGWNGDTVQIAFTSAARTETGQGGGDLTPNTGLILSNYGVNDADGSHESHPCPSGMRCTEMAAVRLDTCEGITDITDSQACGTTNYEIKYPPDALGLDMFYSGLKFGFSICVNDGDTDGASQAGQRGWSGWAPYSILYGKEAENAGLDELVGE